jgi:hypothetical protein
MQHAVKAKAVSSANTTCGEHAVEHCRKREPLFAMFTNSATWCYYATRQQQTHAVCRNLKQLTDSGTLIA